MASSNWLRNKIDKAKKNRDLKKAKETGEGLSNAGVIKDTPKDTQGNYVTPSGKVSVGNKGNVTVTQTIKKSGGGSSDQSVVNFETGETYEITDTGEKIPIKKVNNTPLKLNRSGGVTVGSGDNARTYTGNAEVEGRGKTANQLQQEARQQLNKERPKGSRPIGQGRFSAKGSIQTETVTQGQGDLIFGNSSNAVLDSGGMMNSWPELNTSMEANGVNFNSGEYNSQGQYLYSGAASGPNLQGAFPKFEKQIWNNPNLISIGIPFSQKNSISIEEIKEKQYIPTATEFIFKNSPITSIFPSLSTTYEKSGRFTGEVINEMLPTTPKQVTDTAVITTATIFGGGAVRLALTGGFTVLGTEGALNKNLTPQQRTASAVIALGSGAGFTYEATPFVKGFTNRFAADYTKIPIIKTNERFAPVVKQPQGFNAIETKQFNIGLILEKSPLKEGKTINVQLPKTSPLVRGGFSSPLSEKGIYLGSNQKVATSQIGFFKENMNLKLDREFFVTPEEVTLNIPQARISRMGLTDLWKSSKPSNVQIGFGPKGASQIGIETGASITRTGAGNSWRIGTTTELEAIKGAGTTIIDVKQIGVTTIRGQGVDIFSFKSSPSPKGSSKITGSSNVFTRVTGESILSTTLSPKTRSGILTNAKFTTNSLTPVTTPSFTSVRNTTITNPIFKTFSGKTGRGKTTSIPYINNLIVNFTLRGTTTKYPAKRKVTPIFFYPTPKPPRLPNFTRQKGPRVKSFFKPTRSGGLFTVFGRRFGKFKVIGKAKTEGQALDIGKDFASKTLGATFKIPGVKTSEIPGYKTKLSKKEGKVFIQLPKFRLSSGTEKSEIKAFKRLKGGRKKR